MNQQQRNHRVRMDSRGELEVWFLVYVTARPLIGSDTLTIRRAHAELQN